jgi:tetratricopeptide (TPR) repeat protein
MHQYLQHYQHQPAPRSVNDFISRALAAKHEANLACTYDISHKYPEAVEHYDKAIHLIDELLTHIPLEHKPSSDPDQSSRENLESLVQQIWDEIVQLRLKYSDRMVRRITIYLLM